MLPYQTPKQVVPFGYSQVQSWTYPQSSPIVTIDIDPPEQLNLVAMEHDPWGGLSTKSLEDMAIYLLSKKEMVWKPKQIFFFNRVIDLEWKK